VEQNLNLLLAAEVNNLARSYLNFGRDRARRQLRDDPQIEEKMIEWEKENGDMDRLIGIAYMDIIAVSRKIQNLNLDPKYADALSYVPKS
jgi:hypothetical protein